MEQRLILPGDGESPDAARVADAQGSTTAVVRGSMLGMILFGILRIKGLVTTKAMALLLGPSLIGAYSLMVTTGIVVWPFAALGLHAATTAYIPECRTNRETNVCYTTNLVAALLASTLVLSLMAIGSVRGGLFAYGHAATAVLFAAACMVDQFGRSYLQALQRVRLLALYDFWGQWLAFVLLLVAMAVYRNAVASLLGLAVGILLPACWLQWFIYRELGAPKLHFDRAFRKRLRFAVVILPAGLLQWGLQSADYFFVRHFCGDAMLGQYSVAYNIGFSLTGLFYILHAVVYPTLVRSSAKSPSAFREQYVRFGLGFLLLGHLFLLAAVTVGPPLLLLVTAPTFVDSAAVFPIVMGCFYLMLLGILPLDGLQLQKRAGVCLACYASAFALNLLLNWLLIPRHGIWGAAVATLASFAVLFVLLTIAMQKLKALSGRLLVLTTVFLGMGASQLVARVLGAPILVQGAVLCLNVLLVSVVEWRRGTMRLLWRLGRSGGRVAAPHGDS